MSWTTVHLLECTNEDCSHLFEYACPITEAGEGNWPPCPLCTFPSRKVWQPNPVWYRAQGFAQQDRINKETEPIPGAYEPIG